ncbi:MAG: ATP synthase F0 subunit B [Anaerolineae bacterium]|nr:ATP synthase F0 subunit B [Anaerolineae bacterium]
MDIQHLVDRLEDLIDEGRHLPFSKFTMIDEERALEIIDQMRISIPEEIEKASRILAQRDRVLAQANEEAARLLQQARAKGEEMLTEDVNVQSAQNMAANIIEQANQEVARIKAEADQYIFSVLSKLEQTLQGNLNTVRNGINAVRQPQPQPTSTTVNVTAPVNDDLEFSAPIEVAEEQPVTNQSRIPGISLRRSGKNNE